MEEAPHAPNLTWTGRMRLVLAAIATARCESGRESFIAPGNEDGFRGPGPAQQGCSSLQGIPAGARYTKTGGTIPG